MDNIENDTVNDDDENPNMQRHVVTLSKFAKRSLADAQIVEQVNMLIARIKTGPRVARGWDVEWDGKHHVQTEVAGTTQFSSRKAAGNKTYVVSVIITNRNGKGSAAQKTAEFRTMVSVLVAASNRFPNWTVYSVDGQGWSEVETQKMREAGSDYVGYAPFEIPGNWREHFNHIYERDSQIELVMSSLWAAADSDWENRFNAILAGPPACGKSELLTSLRKMLGDDAVLALDGTAMTQAGLTKELTEREELPRVIIVEEIEKGEEPALRVLLGMMDTRGEIRKITAREKIHRDARCIVMGTCNDYTKLEGMMAGALASRFGEPIYFPRPSRELMGKILAREIKKIDGNPAWIEPVLDYCGKRGINDPRKAISFALRGRDGWLDGSFETSLETVRNIGAATNG